MKPLIVDYEIKKVSESVIATYDITFYIDDDLLLINGGEIDILDYIVKLHCPISRTKFDLSNMAIVCEDISLEMIISIMHWIDKFNCMKYHMIQEFFVDLVRGKYSIK